MLQKIHEEINSYDLIPLLNRSNQKPIDIGNGAMSASVTPDGRICSINRPHQKHGYITLTSMEQFPNDKWYDPSFVRNYRKELAVGTSGFGLLPQKRNGTPEIYLLDNKHPYFYFHDSDVDVSSSFFIEKEWGVNFLKQQINLVNKTDVEMLFPMEVIGQLSLNRASYGQLTEGGPIPIPRAVLDVSLSRNKLVIRNPNLGARAEVSIFENNEPVLLEDVNIRTTKPFTLNQVFYVSIQPYEKKVLTAVYALDEQEQIQLIADDYFPSIEDKLVEKSSTMPIDWKEFVISRNINYIVSCCSVPTNGESICVITDHQLLPLAWNRDAYYMMQLLFHSLSEKQEETWRQEVKRIIKGHLIWMFEDAQRPDGYWGRAYLTNGQSKDPIFQLDQQCYPILELCDYYLEFGDHGMVLRLFPYVNKILLMLNEHKAENHWLFKTGETPADDEVEYPYHFSSQVLVWHMLMKLDKVNKELNLSEVDYSVLANKVKRDCLANFITKSSEKELFAYLTDLEGNYQLYHDANDLPTVYAPLWGFCEKTDPVWVETMKFAFSEANKGGYYPGPFEGLGSVHTPNKWPLGDGQELLFAWLTGDKEQEEYVSRKLKQVVQWDGLFSEAVYEESGEIASRHWFSWPGAFISSVILLKKSQAD
ncbi:hypothetical protein A8F94_08530 [Bacillus sp. FJAT-27225]|uniref:glycoside hydrolase family 125 protein n=1 Tax=Bacillus sp. FJAT-27225 TaxID=1743144 RepID=UPI00080C3016|nr:glycoside hydrolase family 125 protein [Bacillus sp. FJAT-27225]OCA87874.1 hypothetical protein A8F94_08530 [Bacillus sp. FJAT-27225]